MDLYSTEALRGVVTRVQTPTQFLLNTFFGNIIDAMGSEEIVFDVLNEKRRVTPFVSPLLPGKLVQSQGYYTERFKPAYVKDKRALNPFRPLKRRAGEQLFGAPNISPAQREAAILAEELQDMLYMYQRRQELMAADTMDDGILTVTGEGYPSVQVNFLRDTGLTVSLAGGARWGQAGVSPLANLKTWMQLVLTKSGIAVTDIVFTPDAFEYLAADPAFQFLLNLFYRDTSDTSANLFFGGVGTLGGEGAMLQGSLGATGIRLWVYNGLYVDPADNTEKSILPPGTVLMGSADPRAQGARAYGAIIDPDAGYQTPINDNFYVKSWVEKDPGQRIVLAQGAPLTVLSRPNATFRARIV